VAAWGESGEINCPLPTANCQQHRVRWMDGWMLMMMMMTLHHGLPQITACLKALLSAERWCSVDSRASVTSPHIGTCRPGGQEAAVKVI